jgi:flagellar biosynthetic protein FliQ
MTDKIILDISTQTVWIMLKLAAPPLLAAVLAGLAISIVQAATQINEQTITFIPKVLLMTIAMLICGPWMLHTMVDFTTKIITEIPDIIRPE